MVATDSSKVVGLPRGMRLVQGLTYAIDTTADFKGELTACFSLYWITDRPTFDASRILHREGDRYIDRTILHGPLAPDFATRRRCARVGSLSQFAVAIPDTRDSRSR